MTQNHNNHHHQPLSPTTTTTTTTTCTTCNTTDNFILHNHIEPRTTTPKKLCTSCFLKHYPTSFCPSCLTLHDPTSLTPPPSSTRFLTCLKCNSISHLTCVPPNTPKSPYLCPFCSNPNFKLFDFKKGTKFDERAARVFLLAAKMAVISVNKAVGTVRVEADRKVKESALARKRAKEAIDHVMMLSFKLKSVKQQRKDIGFCSNSDLDSVKIEKNGNVVVPNGNGNGNVAAVAVAPPGNGGNGIGNDNGNENGNGIGDSK